ncbi:MAG: hypothetical protein ABSG24_07755 [Acidimicrobiales bacterium]
MSSFDAPRPRSAPEVITGTDLQGEPVTITMSETTLIVAIKQSCDGCRDFVRSELRELDGVAVIILSATGDVGAEWVDAVQPIIVAPDALAQLDIRWPPFYVLVNPRERRVISEGVVFGPSQVASEIAPYLTSS